MVEWTPLLRLAVHPDSFGVAVNVVITAAVSPAAAASVLVVASPFVVGMI